MILGYPRLSQSGGGPEGPCCQSAGHSSFSAPSTHTRARPHIQTDRLKHTHTNTHTVFGFELKCCANMFCDLCFYCWYGLVQLLSFHIH